MGISIFEHSASSGASATGKPEKRKGKAKRALRPLWHSPQFRKIFILRNYVYPYYTSCPRRLSRRFEKKRLVFLSCKRPGLQSSLFFFLATPAPKKLFRIILSLCSNTYHIRRHPPPARHSFQTDLNLKKAAYQISFQRLPQRGFASQSAPQRGAFPRPSPLFLNLSCFPAHFPNVLSPAAPKKQLKGRACA